eukprot:NODE_171_length_16024_cov_0.172559.p8 type:complete len:208 gc:universal NODE_171_length_16024_cov_0.172559:8637-9260(+)
MIVFKRLILRENIWTVPNFLTLTRVGLTPVLFGSLVQHNFKTSLALLAICTTSDLLDGYFARKLNQSTIFGSFFDPFADKFFVASVSVALQYIDLMPPFVFVTFVGRDLVLLATSMYWRYAFLPKPKSTRKFLSLLEFPSPRIVPTYASKVNTGLQMGYITTLVTTSYLGWNPNFTELEVLVVCTSVWSMFQYVLYPHQAMKRLKRK